MKKGKRLKGEKGKGKKSFTLLVANYPLTRSPISLSLYLAGLRKLYRSNTRSGIGVPLRMAGKK
jgi:hypothetical protein